uniref:KilA-N domain-containing protein n=1 Tax=viral metagenome TaxID=1070528 RepID=A0A6C0DAK0_9ZZZZ
MGFKCKICNNDYKSYKSLWNHNKKFHIIKDKLCNTFVKNGNTFVNNCNTFVTQCNTNTSSELKCKYCNKIFNHYNNKWRHEKTCKNKLSDNKISNDLQILKEDINQIKESPPINNQLINIIIEKNKTIEELQNKIDDTNIIKNNNLILNDISLILNNTDIINITENNYINATQICNASKTNYSDWYSLDTTKELIFELEKISKKNNIYELNKDIWIHPELAIDLSRWISPRFFIIVSNWLRNIFIHNNKTKEIELKDQKIQLLQDICIKKQKRTKCNGKNVIYILTTQDNKKKRIYIIGKASNLKNRLSTYNKTAEHEVIYSKECKKDYLNTIENMVLIKLDIYREKANRDRFILPIENDISLFINIINNSISYFN